MYKIHIQCIPYDTHMRCGNIVTRHQLKKKSFNAFILCRLIIALLEWPFIQASLIYWARSKHWSVSLCALSPFVACFYMSIFHAILRLNESVYDMILTCAPLPQCRWCDYVKQLAAHYYVLLFHVLKWMLFWCPLCHNMALFARRRKWTIKILYVSLGKKSTIKT